MNTIMTFVIIKNKTVNKLLVSGAVFTAVFQSVSSLWWTGVRVCVWKDNVHSSNVYTKMALED